MREGISAGCDLLRAALNGEPKPRRWWSAPGAWFALLTVVVSAVATATFVWAQSAEPEVFQLRGHVTSIGISGLEIAPPPVAGSPEAKAGRATALAFRPELLNHVTSLKVDGRSLWDNKNGDPLSMLALTRASPTRPFCDQIDLGAIAGNITVVMSGRTAARDAEKCALGLSWSGGGNTELAEGERLVVALEGNEPMGLPVFGAALAGGLEPHFETSTTAVTEQRPFPGKNVRMAAQWVLIDGVDLLPGSAAFDVSALVGNPDEVAAIGGAVRMTTRRRLFGARPLNIVATIAAVLTFVFSAIKAKREIFSSGVPGAKEGSTGADPKAGKVTRR